LSLTQSEANTSTAQEKLSFSEREQFLVERLQESLEELEALRMQVNRPDFIEQENGWSAGQQQQQQSEEEEEEPEETYVL